MAPSFYYYLGLYLLVFAIRYFKLKKETKDQFDWRQCFHVSLEIVYTSAGVVILLLENLRNWIPPIVIFYILFVLASSNLDSMSERFSRRQQLIFHSLIISFVLIATFFTFSDTLRPQNKDSKNYIAVIPYVDISLMRHVGYSKLSDKKLVYYVKIQGETEQDVLKKAEENFWQDNSTSPFKVLKNENKKDLLKIEKNDIFVKKVE